MKTLIIAEAGVNHNGSLEKAFKLVDAAVEAGADIVKFQSFKAEKLASSVAVKARYQQETTGSSETQLEMLKRLELSESHHVALVDYCRKVGIEFLSTPFDPESLDFLLRECRIQRIKVGSGDLTNAPMLHRCGQTGLPVILSTGMALLEEVREAIGALVCGALDPKGRPSRSRFSEAFHSAGGRSYLREKVCVLHCVTEYPAPYTELNLRVIETLRRELGTRAGYSDHSLGIHCAIAAVALGAEVIEKHFTLDKTLPGPDHRASLEPHELKEMVRSIRDVEAALGNGEKRPSPSEIPNKNIARRSLVASVSIRKGDLFSLENLAIKRPGNGISPMDFWDTLGKPAMRDYGVDELIDPVSGDRG